MVFDYEIYDTETDELLVTGHTVQVFLDKDYNLMWENPLFYAEWKNKWLSK